MIWIARHLGVPYAELGRSIEGADCWGLVRLVYRDALGIDLPSYAAASPCRLERAEIAALFGDRAGAPWRAVPLGEARPLDLAVFRIGGLVSHVGILVDAAQMLHIERGRGSVVERLDEPRWASRLAGIHRHQDAAP